MPKYKAWIILNNISHSIRNLEFKPKCQVKASGLIWFILHQKLENNFWLYIKIKIHLHNIINFLIKSNDTFSKKTPLESILGYLYRFTKM